MMFISITIIYLVLIIYVTKIIFGQYEQEYSEETGVIAQKYQDLVNKKDGINKDRKYLENETLNIFTLYEMTKDISKTIKEEEALEILKLQLKSNVYFEDCSLFDPLSKDIEELKSQGGHFLFTLRDKKRKLAILAIKGLFDADKEKAMILGHQFALALRRIKLYREVETLAITDSLTGAHTRRYFLERFEEELKRSRLRSIKLSFLMIDVDKFKSCNDKFGHLTGDKILHKVGNIIKENIREIDILGRYGGEEFCVVLPDTDRDSAYHVAERIRATAAETVIKAYDAEVKVTVSIGVATFPKDGKGIKSLMDKSDWALYRAKEAGRNKVCVFGLYDE